MVEARKPTARVLRAAHLRDIALCIAKRYGKRGIEHDDIVRWYCDDFDIHYLGHDLGWRNGRDYRGQIGIGHHYDLRTEWLSYPPGRVLTVNWHAYDEPIITTFRRGDWEALFVERFAPLTGLSSPFLPSMMNSA